MKPDFEKCVRAICESLLSKLPTSENTLTPARLDCAVQFILSTHSDMPDHLRWPFRVLTGIFDALPIVIRGKPFHSLPLTYRKQVVSRWQHSSLAIKQDFIRFFDTLGTLAFESSTEEGPSALEPHPAMIAS